MKRVIRTPRPITPTVLALILAALALSVSGAPRAELVVHDSHDALYRFPFGAVEAGTPVRLRISTGAGDFERVLLTWQDTQVGLWREQEMEPVGTVSEDNRKFWETTLTVPRPTIASYHFILHTEEDRWFYGNASELGGPGRFGRAVPPGYQLTVYVPGFTTPDWLKQATIYQIFPDRFRSSDAGSLKVALERGFRGPWPAEVRTWDQLPDNPREQGANPDYDGDGIWNNDFFGGDLQGIIDSLDYLESLGVTALYLNPIFESPSNHRYDTADYETIDRVLGTEEDFAQLADEARERGMHIILDGVFNHVSDDSRYFDRYGKWPEDVGAYAFWASVYDFARQEEISEADAEKRVREAYLETGLADFTFVEWFEIRPDIVGEGAAPYGGERYDYDGWWDLESLPEIRAIAGSELNLERWADYVIRAEDSIARRWIQAGASGWRIDVPMESADDVWVAFRTYTKGEMGLPTPPHGEPAMIAEEWGDATHYLLGDSFDATMNYRLRTAVLDYLRGGGASALHAQIMSTFEDYPHEAFFALMNLIGSHDTARILTELGYIDTDLFDDAQRAATMPEDRIESLNRAAIDQLKLGATLLFTIPGAPTIYYGDEVGLAGDRDPECRRPMPWDRATGENDLLAYYRQLGALRQAHPVLRTGTFIPLAASGGTYAFGRELLGDTDALDRTTYTLNHETGQTMHIRDHNALAVIVLSTDGADLALDVSGFCRDGVRFTDALSGERYTVHDGELTVSLAPVSAAILISEPGQAISPPEVPTGLEAESGDGHIALSWDAMPGAVAYNLYRTDLPGGRHTIVGEALTEPAFTDEAVENLVQYHYAVASLDATDNESPLSAYVPAVPSRPLTLVEVRTFALQDATHMLEVDQPIPPVAAVAQVAGHEASDVLGPELQARFGFGRVKDMSDWSYTEAVYEGHTQEGHLFSGTFIPDRPGTWFATLTFSTDRGATWTTARWPDGRLPQFEAALNPDVTEPTAPELQEVRTQRRLDAPSHVTLAFRHPEPRTIHHLEILRSVDGSPWECVDTVSPRTSAYTDEDIAYGLPHVYQVVAVNSWYHRAASSEAAIVPQVPSPRAAPLPYSSGEVEPHVDGKVDDADWQGAAVLPGQDEVQRVWVGYGTRHIYVRVDTHSSPDSWIGQDYTVSLYLGPHSQAPSGTPVNSHTRFSGDDLGMPLTEAVQLQLANVDAEGRGYVFRFTAGGDETWRFASRIQDLGERIARVGETVEFQIPFESIGLDRSEELVVWTRVAIEQEGRTVGLAPGRPAMVRFPPLVTGTVLAEFEDPVGDDHGPGTYTYPTAGVFRDQEGLFDLVRYTIIDQDANWLLGFEFTSLPNPWSGPLGFSHPLIHVYLDVDEGGSTALHPAGEAMRVRFHEDHPWNYFLKIAGWPDYGRHMFAADGSEYRVDVSADPARRTVYVRIPKDIVPSMHGGHYVLIASQDGFGPNNIRPVARQAAEWTGGGNPAPGVAPWAYDYLTPEGWTQGEILGSYDAQTGTYAVLVPVMVNGE